MPTFQSVLRLKEPYPFDNFVALARAESREVVEQDAILAGDDG